MDAFEQMSTGPAGAAELPPELVLPQAARLVPMAAATSTIKMRRMGTVLPAGALIAPGDRRRESLPVRLTFTQPPGPGRGRNAGSARPTAGPRPCRRPRPHGATRRRRRARTGTARAATPPGG